LFVSYLVGKDGYISRRRKRVKSDLDDRINFDKSQEALFEHVFILKLCMYIKIARTGKDGGGGVGLK